MSSTLLAYARKASARSSATTAPGSRGVAFRDDQDHEELEGLGLASVDHLVHVLSFLRGLEIYEEKRRTFRQFFPEDSGPSQANKSLTSYHRDRIAIDRV
jgi:hypothetical protein